MRAGPMRHRIRIERKEIVKGTLGSPEPTWVPWADIWAEVRPLSGREYMTGLAAQSEITTRFVIRHLDGLLPSMRILWRSGVYEISQVIPVHGRDRMMEILAAARPVG